MTTTKTTLSVLLTSTLAAPALACDLCSVYSAGQAHGELGQGVYAGVAEQFTHFGTLQFDGAKVPDTFGQRLDSSITQALFGYNFTERCGLQFNLPIVHRSFRRPDDTGGVDRGAVTGPGEAALTGHWVAFNHEKKDFTFRASLLAGVKFPTGSTSRLHEEVDELNSTVTPPIDSGIHGHDLTLGSGSFDGLVGASLFTRCHRVFFSAQTQYAIRSTGDFDYRFANDLTWAGGPGFLAVLGDKHTLALQAIVSGETKARDTFMGMKADDTGITSVFLGPQINYTWSDKLSVELGVDVPVVLRNTDLQSVPDYRVRGALTWHF
jgi:hypothetical protein